MKLIQGDCLEVMRDIPDGSVDLIITSPPYNIGKEYEQRVNFEKYLKQQNEYISECFRITSNDGSICWQVGNYIDKGEVFPLDAILYTTFKSLGMYLRNRIVWTFGHGLHCKKRFSGRHETVLWFTKSTDYKFNLDDVRVPSKYPNKRHYKGPKKGELSGNPLGKNPSDVWNITNVKHNHPEKTAHPCQFPESICERLILSLTNKGDTILDPFMGSGTTGVAAKNLNRDFIGIEMDETYFNIAKERINGNPLGDFLE